MSTYLNSNFEHQLLIDTKWVTEKSESRSSWFSNFLFQHGFAKKEYRRHDFVAGSKEVARATEKQHTFMMSAYLNTNFEHLLLPHSQ